MICRIWRGWTTSGNAAAYEELLRFTVVPDMIEARRIAGFRHIDIMCSEAGEEIEFATIMWFDDLAAIKAFVGEDYEVSHIPGAARALLSRFDERAAHYEVLDRREQPAEG